MKTLKQYSNMALLPMLFLLTLFAAGCGNDDTTAPAGDSATPTVIPTSPINGATGVALNTNIVAFSNKEINASTVTDTTFTLRDGTTAVPGAVSETNSTMLFNPTANLTANTKYTATITIDVLDANSTALLEENMVWSFTTGATEDSTPPIVTMTNPDANATEVPKNRSVTALFNEPLDPSTVSDTTFTLDQNVTGVVSYSGNTIVFNPDANLDANTTYTATITTDVTDLSGNALADAKVWEFKTGDTTVSSLAAVDLGTAGDFVILAKTGVSTTGTTAITGDIGVSPAARTYITGFSDTLFSDGTYSTSPLVTGKIYAANMTPPTPTKMTTAISDMETAYTAATSPAPTHVNNLYAGDLSGKLLTPGVYKWATGVSISDVGVTITGSDTDVWIFQIAKSLTVANGAHVTLAGGAQAKNIFWQVAEGASLGTTADFKGIVLAKTAIVVKTGARANGRLLAQTAVTLDANAVTQP